MPSIVMEAGCFVAWIGGPHQHRRPEINHFWYFWPDPQAISSCLRRCGLCQSHDKASWGALFPWSPWSPSWSSWAAVCASWQDFISRLTLTALPMVMRSTPLILASLFMLVVGLASIVSYRSLRKSDILFRLCLPFPGFLLRLSTASLSFLTSHLDLADLHHRHLGINQSRHLLPLDLVVIHVASDFKTCLANVAQKGRAPALVKWF